MVSFNSAASGLESGATKAGQYLLREGKGLIALAQRNPAVKGALIGAAAATPLVGYAMGKNAAGADELGLSGYTKFLHTVSTPPAVNNELVKKAREEMQQEPQDVVVIGGRERAVNTN